MLFINYIHLKYIYILAMTLTNLFIIILSVFFYTIILNDLTFGNKNIYNLFYSNFYILQTYFIL